MSNVTGKIKDVYEMLKKALKKQNTDGVDVKQSNTMKALIDNAKLGVTFEHLNNNIYPKLTRLYSQNEFKDVGVTFKSNFMDALSLYLYGKDYETKFGYFQGSEKIDFKKEVIKNQKNGIKNTNVLNGQVIKERKNEHRKDIIFAIPKYQETAIPILQKSEFAKYANIIFKDNIEWSECLDALVENKIDIAIHNFPLVLSYIIKNKNPKSIFFFPYLTFNGYAMFVKPQKVADFIKKDKSCVKTLEEIKQQKYSQFFETLKISLDKKTDFEYILKEYCKTNKINWDKISSSIQDKDIDKGKKEFLKTNGVDLYITNTIHKFDLEINHHGKSLLLAERTDFTRHQNYNGLVCSMDFYNDNKEIIKKIIQTWFTHLEFLQNEWKYIIDTNGESVANFQLSETLRNYINKETVSNVDIVSFVKSFKNNKFFNSPNEAYESLYLDTLKTKIGKQANWGIAQTQLKQSDLIVDEQLIEAFINHMSDIYTELGF